MIKIRETNHMEYQEGMEQIDHSIMNKVLEMTDKYDYSKYTAWDVRNVLSKDSIDINDLAVLLSPAAEPMLAFMLEIMWPISGPPPESRWTASPLR